MSTENSDPYAQYSQPTNRQIKANGSAGGGGRRLPNLAIFYGSDNRRGNTGLIRQFSSESQQPFVQPGTGESCESSLASQPFRESGSGGRSSQTRGPLPQLRAAFNRFNSSDSNPHQQFIFVNRKYVN